MFSTTRNSGSRNSPDQRGSLGESAARLIRPAKAAENGETRIPDSGIRKIQFERI